MDACLPVGSIASRIGTFVVVDFSLGEDRVPGSENFMIVLYSSSLMKTKLKKRVHYESFGLQLKPRWRSCFPANAVVGDAPVRSAGANHLRAIIKQLYTGVNTFVLEGQH